MFNALAYLSLGFIRELIIKPGFRRPSVHYPSTYLNVLWNCAENESLFRWSCSHVQDNREANTWYKHLKYMVFARNQMGNNLETLD